MTGPVGDGTGEVRRAEDPADRPRLADRLAREAGGSREDAARVRAAVDPYPGEPAPGPGVPARPRATSGVTSPRVQRWAVNLTAGLLAVLAVGLGLRGAWTGSSPVVPETAPGAPESEAAAAVVRAGLEPSTVLQASTSVPRGHVLSVRPAAGVELEPGDGVVLVVSSGPPGPAGDLVVPAPAPAGPDDERDGHELKDDGERDDDNDDEPDEGKDQSKGKDR